MDDRIGLHPAGLWPSEGSVSDEALHLAAEPGFNWFATDNGVLGRTLQRDPRRLVTYRPYLWKQGDHQMSRHFPRSLSQRSDRLRLCAHGRRGCGDALPRPHSRKLPAHSARAAAMRWSRSFSMERMPGNTTSSAAGRFYGSYTGASPTTRDITALTVVKRSRASKARRSAASFPGSWINANFDIWIGAEEDNKAWEYLLRARQTYERFINSPDAASIPEARKKLAYEELLIAEGSDWNWWYGPEHDSANRPEFDQLFRGSSRQRVHALSDWRRPKNFHGRS